MAKDNIATSAQLARAVTPVAEKLNVPMAALAAVVWVESGGIFYATINGRKEPLIRFEGHYFDRLLNEDERAQARQRGLSHPKAGHIKNPAPQAGRWDLLQRAQSINRNAALESTSWGAGQVMGANWKSLGYASVEALVLDARSGLPGQLRAMARFIKKRGLADKLRNHDFAGFARVYNGPAFAKHGYHTRMEIAFEKFGGVSNDTVEQESHCPRLGSTGDDVATIQSFLVTLGLLTHVDGDFGPQTDQAVRRFQAKQNLVVDGIAGPETFKTLGFWADTVSRAADNQSLNRLKLDMDPARSLRYSFSPWNRILKPFTRS